MSFDWYMSPADRFSYESQFDRYSKNDAVTLQDLDPLFQNSRISTEEFLQIWQLVDIRFEQQISKIQFVYFCHCLNSRRRGRTVPTGLPLSIKEEFLKDEPIAESKVYVRPVNNSRDIGSSANSSTKQLKEDVEKLDIEIRAIEKERELAEQKFNELKGIESEVQGLYSYTLAQSNALQKEADAFKDSQTVNVDPVAIRQALNTLENDYKTLLQRSRDFN